MMLVSIHVPKTAGTSFRMALEKYFGARMALDYGRESQESTKGLVRMLAQHAENGDDQTFREWAALAGISCIHGHFEARKYLDLFPDAQFVAWVRNPIERVVSHFEQCRRVPDDSDFLNRAVRAGMPFHEFVRHPEARDLQTRRMDGVPLDGFFFVGVVELFALCMVSFFKRLGSPCPPVDTWNANPGKGLRERYPLTDAEAQFILDQNRRDVALYHGVLESWAKRY